MNGVTSSNMEEPNELTLPNSIKPGNIVNDDCHNSNVDNNVNDNSENDENKEEINSPTIKDVDIHNDALCAEKIFHTDMDNSPEKICFNLLEENIIKSESKVDSLSIQEIASLKAEPDKVDSALVKNNDNLENQMDSHFDIEPKKESLSKGDNENLEQECIKEISSNSQMLNGDYDNSTIETSQTYKENNEIDILQKQHEESTQNGNIQSVASPAVEEILSDNNYENERNSKKNSTEKQMQLHCSDICEESKECKNDDNPDIYIPDLEEVSDENFWDKHKPILVKDTKTLVHIATKHLKPAQSGCQKKKPTVVFIDTNSGESEKPNKNLINSNISVNAHSLFQSIIAGGASITPITSKTNSVAQKSSSDVSQPPANQHILPSLTDDMFVVEAPSFIVPYVYEKPSIKPFRDYVDLLGKELNKLSFNEEINESNTKKELLDSYEQSENKDTNEIEKDEECNTKDENIKKEPVDAKKAKKKRRRNDDDDASWDGESSTDLDENVISDEDEEDKTLIIKVKTKSDENLINVSGLAIEKVLSGKPDNYFDCSLGSFFIDIGLNLVQEFVQNDLLKEQNRKLNREKKAGHNTKATENSIASLTKNLELSKKNNAPFHLKQHKCLLCSFKTDSQLVLAHHLETPHMKNNVYKCNYCTFEVRNPHEILHHMEAAHKTQGKLERALAYHQCANCPFEDNGKGKLARHQISCAKKFKPDLNLAPTFDWEPPAKIPKTTRSRNSLIGPYPSAFHRSMTNSPIRAARVPGTANTTVQRNGGCVKVGGSLRVPKSSPAPIARVAPIHGGSMIRGGVIRNNASLLLPINPPVTSNCKNVGSIKSLAHQPSISVTPLPRQSRPSQPQPAHQSKNTFVICEICDGYIKDLEQLRNHMQWIHKVKIHPKMIYNRPPLNCQKCRCRFFTDQGLERHLLGSHGLVTSSMQQAANKKRDAGRCPVCGRVYQWKLLNHVSRDHNLTLKPAHLSYKCTVCTATFAMYKQFESHVYSVHSVVAKCVMDKSKVVPKKSNDSLLKPLKINDEITIIPSPDKD